jgi:heat shock 70kDa protein 4
MSGLNTQMIEFVELVGEATRIPIVIDTIKKAFNREPSRTLNSQDCIARGCALQAAMLSRNFDQANQIFVEDFNALPVSISYQFKDSKTDKQVTKELFKAGSLVYPSTKSITFDGKQGGCSLLLHYTNGVQLPEGIPT